MTISPNARTVWRNYVTDGVPSSGNHKVEKAAERTWGTAVETAIDAYSSGAGSIAKSTRALLYADLAHAADVMAWVYADSTVAYNGIYRKSGASGSGSWSRILDLPYDVITATDAGAGTPNAIIATTSVPVSESALILLNVYEANTGSPVTVSFNGGSALAIKTASGNNVAAGGLVAGAAVLGRISGSTFRMVSDQASAAIQAAAEAAQAAAEAAAADAAESALVAAAGGRFATVAALAAASIALVVQYVDVAGYAAAGDGGGHRLVRISTPSPVKAWHRQSADGAYWEVSEERPTPRMFGAAGNGSTNDSTAIQAANDYAAAKNRTLYFNTGLYLVAATTTISAAWSMAEDAFITCAANTRSLTSSTKLLSCTESNLRFGPINIDGNSSEFWAVLHIAGSNNYFPVISVKNLRCSCTVGDNPVNRAVVVAGDNNVVPFTFFRDFTEVNSAVNYPTHGLVCEGTATGNLFHNVTSRNVRGTVVDNAQSGTNHYGHICAHEARGNGLYGVNAGKSVVGTLTYDGSDNAAGFRHGHSSQIGDVVVSRASANGATIFFGNCGDISISSVNAKNCSTLFLTNDTDGSVGDTYTTAGNISIGVVRAELKNGYPFFFSASQGPVKSLRVGDFNAVITIDDLTNFGPASFMNLGGVDKVEIDRINVKLLLGPVIDTVRSFTMTLKNPLTQKSYVDEINAEFYTLDGTTLSSNGLFAVANVGQEYLRIDRGLLNTSANSIGISNTTRRGKMTATGAPSAGYWPIGTIIYSTAPTSSLRGWICTASGTPGTWSAW